MEFLWTTLSGLQRVNSESVDESIASAPNPSVGNSLASVATHSTNGQPGGKSPASQSFATADDFVQSKTQESNTSPADVSDLLRSSSPEPHLENKDERPAPPSPGSEIKDEPSPDPHTEGCMRENMEERPAPPSPTSEIKDEPRDLLEESVHIDESPPGPEEGVKSTLEDQSGIERKLDQESGGLRGAPKMEKNSTIDLRDSGEPVHVILVMRLEGYPVRKLRLKSTQSVIVAMRKFATASGFNYKELR